MKRANAPENSDEVEKVWARKLKEMEIRQSIFAENAVTYILLEFQLGTLHKDSVTINAFNPATLYS